MTSSSSCSSQMSSDEEFYDALSSDDDNDDKTKGDNEIAPQKVMPFVNENIAIDTNKMGLMSDSLTSGIMTMSVSVVSDRMAESGASSSSELMRDNTICETPDVVPKIEKSLSLKRDSSSSGDNIGACGVSKDSKCPDDDACEFERPKPPPRIRKKKPIKVNDDQSNDVKNDNSDAVSDDKSGIISSDSIIANQNVSNVPSQNVASEAPASSSGLLKSPNLASFLDDIASIKGDLSVNEIILSQCGDRRSVYIDETSQPANDEIDANKTSNDGSSNDDVPKVENVLHENEILNEIMVLNKDTGEKVPLSKADELIKQCLNPLSLHLMKLNNELPDGDSNSYTSEFTTHGHLLDHPGFDYDEEDGEKSGAESKKEKLRKKMKNLKKLGSGIIKGVKGVKASKERSTFHVELKSHESEPQPNFKIKLGHKKGVPDFEGLRQIQELYDCRGAIWCLKWSVCGQLMAVAGQDHLLRVYCCQKAWKYFTQLRNKASGQQISPNSTRERDNRSFSSQRSGSLSSADNFKYESASSSFFSQNQALEDNTLSEEGPLLLFSVYRGHTADVLDISWSKNHFLLSSSMDKTVRLWHITRIECLCTFRHIDFVTTIQFHPRDDRYFLSGSLDGKLRLWNIPDKRVTLWNEVMALPTQKSGHESVPCNGLITSSSFVQNGKFAVIGTYDGRIIFYSTDQLKYFTQLHVSGSGKNAGTAQSSNATGNSDRRKRNNKKVTGIEGVDETKILVTTNDSRIRLYDLRDLSLACKYRGCQNQSSQIKASISHDSKYIICGSENSSFYIWRLQTDNAIGQRRDRNKQFECVRILPQPLAHQTVLTTDPQQNAPAMVSSKIVTAAIFAPVPGYIDETAKYIIAAADFNGYIRIFAK